MRLTARCPECEHQYNLDSSYLGMKRKCPECQALFTFEQPVEAAAEGGLTAVKQALGMTVRLGCPACLRLFTPNAAFASHPEQRCSFCDARMTMEVGLETARLVETVEPASMGLLLIGTAHREVLPMLAQQGLAGEALPLILTRQLRQLPFERYQRLVNGNTDVPLQMAADCDLCGKSLPTPDRAACYFVHWYTRNEEEDKSRGRLAFALFGLAGWLVARSAGGGGHVVENELKAIYCLCQGCRKSLTSTFGRFDGYPASGGFEVRKLKEHRQCGEELKVAL